MLTQAAIRELYPRAPDPHLRAFSGNHGTLFERFEIGANKLRLHFFLAQLGHESGGLTMLSENLNYRAERLVQVWPRRFPSVAAARPYVGHPEALANKVYAGRMGNGPEGSGDGWRFRGRGYIQLTGRDAYQAVGRAADLDLTGNPDVVLEPDHGLQVACGFWQWKGLNALCDTGDYEKVTRRINGGVNGITDRKAWLDKVRRVLLTAPTARGEAPGAERVVAIQRALQSRGYREVGAADGAMGPRLIAGIERFRQEKGLGDGLIDPALEQALGIPD